MAAIALSSCTYTIDPQVGFNLYTIVTPATADDGDTIDVSSIIDGAKIASGRCTAATDGNLNIATITEAGVVTIPGSTDNEARTLYLLARI